MDIILRDIYKRFGANEVLKGLNLTIRGGETTVIIGGSGAGKSVLLKLIIGLLCPDRGSIFVNGADIARLPEIKLFPIRQKFGMIFQSGGLLNSLTVGDNVALGLREHQIVPESDIKRVVADKLRLLGLEGKENEMPATLSGGMKKRVSIARALTMNPEVILYDEPTAGLDPPMADNIDNLILELNRQLGVTSVIVTHDLISVFKTADTINMLHEGRIIKTGRVEDFRTSPDEIVKEFLKRK